MKVGQTIQKMGPVMPSNFVKMTKLLGFEHLEFDPTVFEDIDATIPLIGTQSVVLHAPFYSWWEYDLSSKQHQKKVEIFIDNVQRYAKKLKTQAIVVHPPQDPYGNNEFFIENLNQLPVKVLLENLPGQNLSEFEHWYHSVKKSSSAPLEICFDVPHSFLTHGTQLFNIPESLLPDLHYIHISELNSQKDCHWPFGTPGGELPFDLFEEFLESINFDGIINMEMLPSDLNGVENLINSYLKLKKLGPKLPYFIKKIRIGIVKPFLLKKLKKVPLQSEPEKHHVT